MSLGWIGQVMLYLIYYLPYAGMFVAAVLSLYSGLDYLVKNRELFQEPRA